MTVKKTRRNADNYDPTTARKNNAGSSAGLFNGIFNKDIQIALFNGDQSGTTLFRPLPAPDFESPADTLFPGRISEDPGNFSHWQRPARIVKFAGLKEDGCEKFSLYMGDLGADVRDNPYFLLASRLKKGSDGKFQNNDSRNWDPSWSRLVKDKLPPVPSIADVFFVMAAIYKGFVYNSEAKKNVLTDFLSKRDYPLGLQPGDALPIVALTGQTGRRLISGFEGSDRTSACDALLDKRDEKGEYLFGDPTGTFNPESFTVSGGVLCSMFYPDHKTKKARHTTFSGTIAEAQGYEINVNSVINFANNTQLLPDMDEAATRQAVQVVQFWNDSSYGANDGLFRVQSQEEIAVSCVKAFKTMPRIFQFVWADRSDLLHLDDVRAVLSSRTSSAGRILDDEQPTGELAGSNDRRPQQQGGNSGGGGRVVEQPRRDPTVPTRRPAPPVQEIVDEDDTYVDDVDTPNDPLPEEVEYDDEADAVAEEFHADDAADHAAAAEYVDDDPLQATDEATETGQEVEEGEEAEEAEETQEDGEIVDGESDDELFSATTNPVVEDDPVLADTRSKMQAAKEAASNVAKAAKEAAARSQPRVAAGTVASAPRPAAPKPAPAPAAPKPAPRPAVAPVTKPAPTPVAAKPPVRLVAKPAVAPTRPAATVAKPAAPAPAAVPAGKKPIKRT